MVVAMMLPSSLGVMTLFRAMTRQRRNQRMLTIILVSGYLTVWALFGVVVYLSDLFVHGAVERVAWLEEQTWLIATATLGMAGAYQFTALKYRCLNRCRSPRSFVTEHWRGWRERWEAWWLGSHHGRFCAGCCWSLMRLMFAIGVGHLGWMLVLGTIMAVEKNALWGRRLSAPLGVVLLAAALALPLVIAA
jgi:predicted metal-binding membrane protein